MKSTNPDKVLRAHERGEVNLKTMTVGQVCEKLNVGKDSVSAARGVLNIKVSHKHAHTDDGTNSYYIKRWKP